MILAVGQYVREGVLFDLVREGETDLFFLVGIEIGDMTEWCFAFLSLHFLHIHDVGLQPKQALPGSCCFSVSVLLCLFCVLLTKNSVDACKLNNIF
jgi:hypothetical protein